MAKIKWWEGTDLNARACGPGLKRAQKFGSLKEAWEGFTDPKTVGYNAASDNMRWLVSVYGQIKPWSTSPATKFRKAINAWYDRQTRRQNKLRIKEANKRGCESWNLPSRVDAKIRKTHTTVVTCDQVRKLVSKKDLALIIKAAMAAPPADPLL